MVDRSGWSPSAGRHGDLCGPLRQRVLAKRLLVTRPTKRPAISNLDRMPCPDTRIAWRSKWRISGCNGGQRCATPYMSSCFDSLRAHVILRRFQTEIEQEKHTFPYYYGSQVIRAVSWSCLASCEGSLCGVPLQHYSHLAQLCVKICCFIWKHSERKHTVTSYQFK